MKAGLDAAAAARCDEGSPDSLSVTLWRELRKNIGYTVYFEKGFSSSTFETRSRTLGPGPFKRRFFFIVCTSWHSQNAAAALHNNTKCVFSLSLYCSITRLNAQPSINRRRRQPHYCLFRMLHGQEIVENEEFLLFLLIPRHFEIFFPPTSACIFIITFKCRSLLHPRKLKWNRKSIFLASRFLTVVSLVVGIDPVAVAAPDVVVGSPRVLCADKGISMFFSLNGFRAYVPGCGGGRTFA